MSAPKLLGFLVLAGAVGYVIRGLVEVERQVQLIDARSRARSHSMRDGLDFDLTEPGDAPEATSG